MFSGPVGRAVASVLFVLTILGVGGAPTAQAQGTVRVVISGVPPVLSTPVIGELERNLRQGRYTTQVIYSNPGGPPVQVRLRATLRYEGEQIIETVSRPVTYDPGTYVYRTFDESPSVTFEETTQDIIDQLNDRLRNQVTRAGVLPEGEYIVEVRPELIEPRPGITPVAGRARTTVRYPQPPTLTSPTNGAMVTAGLPVFSWTPVNGTAGDVFEYEFLLVRVRPGQTPLQAIRANRPVTGRNPVTVRRTSFSYTRSFPPLEEGATYAWQVRATETANDVPISEDGESPIRTFTYRGQQDAYTAADLIAPESGTTVPGADALEFRWRSPDGPSADDPPAPYERVYQRLVVAPRDEDQEDEQALDENRAVVDDTLSFQTDQVTTLSSLPETLSDGRYVWAVRLIGETADGDTEILTRSPVAGFRLGEAEEPPVAAGGTIRLTSMAALVGTENLDQEDDTYSGRAQLALDLGGTGQPIRLPAQVSDLTATPNEAGTLVAQAGEVASTQLDSSLPFQKISGLDVASIRWGEDPDSLHVEATLSLDAPFDCENASVGRPETAFTLLPNGMLQGTVAAELDCRIPIGPFEAVPTRTTLRVGQSRDGQVARLQSEADLMQSSEVLASGRLEANLVTGELKTLRFTVDEPFEWGLPSDDPVLTFRVQRAEVDRNGLMMDGRNRLLLPGGNDVRATFDSLNVGFESGRIQSGRVIFDSGFAFEAGMNPNGTNLTYRAVPSGSPLKSQPGLLFSVADTTVLDRSGLQTRGSATGRLSFGQWSPDLSLEAEFSDDFGLRLEPFGIGRGQVDFIHQGATVGYVDQDGFHPDPSYLLAQVPEKLPLPNDQVAYLRLKENGTPLVTLSQQSGGTAVLSTKPGKTLDLVLPAVDSTTISAQVQNLTVSTRGGFDYQSGTVTAQVSGSPLDLTDQDLPLYLTAARYGKVNVNGTSRTGLFLTGQLALFGRNTGTDGEITLAMDQSGTASGQIRLSNLGTDIPLAGNGKATLTVDSLDGQITAPAAGPATYDWTLGGDVTLRDGNTTIASAGLGLRVTEQGLTVQQFTPRTNQQTQPLRLGGVGLDLEGIPELKRLAYSEPNGFDFRFGLDLTVRLSMPSGKTFAVPLKGVEIFRNAQTGNGGFSLPKQTLHANTKPALDDQQTLGLGPVDLRLFNAALTRDVTVDWFQAPKSAAQALSALEMDFGLTITSDPSLKSKELTIYDAGIQDGVLTGRIETFSYLSGQKPTVDLGGTAGVTVDSISGGLINRGTPQNPKQGVTVNLNGQLDLPDTFARGASTNCPSMDVSAGLTRGGGLEATVSNFAACGNVQFGPASLTFPSSTLTLAVQNGTQQARLSGQAKATIQGANHTLSATGTAEYDLIDGQLLAGNLTFRGAFDYGIPQRDPLFSFRVQKATLSAAGLVFSGTGSLRTEQDQQVATVAFNQLTVHPDSSIVSGSATLQSQFGLEIGMQQGQVDWRIIQPSAPTPSNPALRVTMPASLTLNKKGLSVGGSSTASLNFNGNTYASLSADFKPVHLGLNPVEVDSGRVDFTSQAGTRVAYYDTNGFHFDAAGVAVASVPEKLGLPTTDVAYLKLRDDQGNELVTYESASGGGYKFSSVTDANGKPKPVKLVLASVDSQGTSPTFDVTIPKANPLAVDAAFQKVQSGTITTTVDEPLGASYDIPLRLQKLVYEKNPSGTYALTADGTVDLPEGIGGEAVSFKDLGFGTGGPRGTIETGTYAGSGPSTGKCSDVPSSMPSSPVASAAYTNGSLQTNLSDSQLNSADLAVRLQGAELSFGPNGHSFVVLGDVTSRFLRDPSGGQTLPDNIAFTGGYSGGTWNASLCTGRLPSDKNGDNKISLQVADLYLDDNVGGGIGLEVGPNETNLSLSGTARFPDVLGGSFAATVKDLKMGTAGVKVAEARAATGGQSFRLFNGELKVETDPPPQGFGVTWDSQNEEFVLSMSGNVWLTAFMDPSKQADAVQINNLAVSTSGNVSLGSASGNLLASKTLAVIGGKSGPDTTMTLDELRLEKPKGSAALALKAGGALNLSDLMDGVSSDYGLTVDTDGNVTSDSPLRARFVQQSGQSDPVDKIGDNPKTELAFGDVATMDVKEVGVRFVNSQISQPAVYANGAAYIQPENKTVDDLVRFGALGANSASGAGFYYSIGQSPSFNATAQVDQFDLFGFLTLSDMSASLTQESGTRKVVLGGKVGVNVEGAGSASADWEDLKISKQGIQEGEEGHLTGGLSLTLVNVVTLSLDSLDYGTGQFRYSPPDGGRDSTITADKYFKLTGAKLSLPQLNSGGQIDAAYYYMTDGGQDKALKIYGAQVKVKEMATAHLSMAYEKRQDEGIKLFAAGYAKFGTEELSIAGAFESTSGNLRYGLFARYTSGTGIPVAPGVTVTGVGGGFFYRPRSTWLKDVREAALSGSRSLLPETPKWKKANANSEVKLAVYLYGSALVGGVQSQVLIEATDDKTSLYGLGHIKGVPKKRMGVGMKLSVHYGQRKGVEGGILANVTFPTTLQGKARINFAAYVNQSSNTPAVRWFVKGKLGQGDRDFRIMTVYQVSGTFLASNEGLLLKELSVSLGTPNLGIIDINAGATVSFWHVPDEALGAYAKIGVNAKLFGGAAKLGANLRGAYIREERLIYAAAEAYVKVVGVFKGNVGLWVAMEKGTLNGGKGSNDRYDQMVADAQQQAKQMIARAKEAAQKMDEVKSAPLQPTQAAVKEAGVNAIDPESELDRSKVKTTFDQLRTEEATLVSGSTLKTLTHGRDHLVEASDKPSPQQAEQIRQQANAKRTKANKRVDAVSNHLESLTTKQIRWTKSAAKKLEQMSLGSPISNVQSAQYAGSGDNQRMTRSPSWTVDQKKAQQQSQDLSDLKEDIDALNKQYQKSLDDVAENLQTAEQLFEAQVQTGQGQTSINQLAGTFADAARMTRRYDAERADYLWSLSDWAGRERGTLTGKESGIDSALKTAANQGSDADRKSVLMRRFNAFKTLAPDKNQLPSASTFEGNRSSPSSSEFKKTHQRWGKKVWYDIFETGLSVVETNAEQDARWLARRTPGNWDNQGYAQLTNKIDEAYAAKHQFLTTYYGMVEAYRGWRREAGLDESSSTSTSGTQAGGGGTNSGNVQVKLTKDTRLGFRLDSLQKVLRPPQINDITVTRSQDGRTAKADVSVSAQHREEVPEVSYRIRRGTGGSVHAGDTFYSIGDRSSFTFHSFAEKRGQDTQDFTVLVRARGAGGATLTRRANFTLAVSDQGKNNAPDGSVDDAMEADDTPPREPSLTFDYLRRTSEEVMAASGGPQWGQQSIPQTGNTALPGSNAVSVSTLQSQGTAPVLTKKTVSRLWTNSSSTLRMKVETDDRDSDIAGVDYKIGTTKGGDDVRGWTALQGQSTTRNIVTGGKNPDAFTLNGTVRGLRLEEGTTYYVSVRARNGAGLTTVYEHDTPIVYDGTPPDPPGRPQNTLSVRGPSYTAPLTQPHRVVVRPPSWTGAPSAGPAVPPSLSIKWAASTDEASGVSRYEYVVTQGNPQTPFKHPGGKRKRFRRVYADTSEKITARSLSYPDVISSQLSYTDSVWVHVRALDEAGNSSDALTLGPMLPKDPSAPIRPKIHPMVVPDGVRLYFEQAAYDQESGIKGYQYNVVNERTGKTLKAYPSGATTDMGPKCPSASSGAVFQTAFVLNTVGSSDGSSKRSAFKKEEWSPVDEPMGCTPDSGVQTAPYHFIPDDSLTTGEPLKISLRTVNGQGTAHRSASTEPVTLDQSAPTFSASATRASDGSEINASVQDAHDPESGIARVEYYSVYQQGWIEAAAPAEFPTQRTSYQFTYRLPGSVAVNNQGPSTLRVRVTNGARQQTVKEVTITDPLMTGPSGAPDSEINWGTVDIGQ